MLNQVCKGLSWTKPTVRVAAILSLVALILSSSLLVRGRALSLKQSERKIKVLGKDALASVLRIDEIRNINAEDFPKGFQISITNISDKPIYHINMVLVYSKTERVLGRAIISRLTYGASRMANLKELARPEDTPLNSGDTYVFKMADVKAQEVIDYIDKASGSRQELLDDVELHINVVNFGDGTGYQPGKSSLEYRKAQ